MAGEVDVKEIEINEVKPIVERQVTEIQRGRVEEVPLPPTGKGDISTPLFLLTSSMLFIILVATKVFIKKWERLSNGKEL
ncbi:hypothetical protein ACWOE8_07165 [Enterococcus avium]